MSKAVRLCWVNLIAQVPSAAKLMIPEQVMAMFFIIIFCTRIWFSRVGYLLGCAIFAFRGEVQACTSSRRDMVWILQRIEWHERSTISPFHVCTGFQPWMWGKLWSNRRSSGACYWEVNNNALVYRLCHLYVGGIGCRNGECKGHSKVHIVCQKLCACVGWIWLRRCHQLRSWWFLNRSWRCFLLSFLHSHESNDMNVQHYLESMFVQDSAPVVGPTMEQQAFFSYQKLQWVLWSEKQCTSRLCHLNMCEALDATMNGAEAMLYSKVHSVCQKLCRDCGTNYRATGILLVPSCAMFYCDNNVLVDCTNIFDFFQRQ